MKQFRGSRQLIALLFALLFSVNLVAPARANEIATVQGKIVVLPINNAKFLAGQIFDLRVELPEPPGWVTTVDVQVNGQKAADFFGVKPTWDLNAETPYILYSGVSYKAEGTFDLKVTAATTAGSYTRTVKHEAIRADKQVAKNVILFVGDGLTTSMRTAARILSQGLTEGKYNGWLEMDQMEAVGIVSTSGYDSLVTDSANSASAYATGHKSAVNAMGVYADSTPSPNDDPKVENIIELAKRVRGMSTGLVSTSNITDATPAAMVAHTRRRSEQNLIAEQILAGNVDVILGGGARQFLPKSTSGSRRTDERNLIEEAKAAGYQFVGNATEMKAATSSKLLGLFAMDNMNVYLDKAILKNPAVLGSFPDQPTLFDMTETAINALSKNPNGFFLMVEGASIDKQAHSLDWERTIYDTIEFDQAIGVAKRFAEKNDDTLIIVVGDHAHGMSITGTYHEMDGKTGREGVRVYEDAGWPTYVDANGDGFPDSPDTDVTLAVHWANHPDFRDDYKVDTVPTSPAIMANGKAVPNPKKDPNGDLQTGNLPADSTSEVHSADDIPLTATGPGSDRLIGVYDNTHVFHAMVEALGLDPLK